MDTLLRAVGGFILGAFLTAALLVVAVCLFWILLRLVDPPTGNEWQYFSEFALAYMCVVYFGPVLVFVGGFIGAAWACGGETRKPGDGR